MRHISISNTAMAVGMITAGSHVIWVTLVGVGWATSFLNAFLGLHFLQLDFRVVPHSAFTALLLIALTFIVGALFGAIFAIVYNWLTAASEPDWSRDTKRRSPAN